MPRPFGLGAAVLVALAQSTFAAGPPCQVGMTVRASLPPYDAKIIAHDRARGLYRVKNVRDGAEEWLPAKHLKTCTGEEPPPVTESFFAGQWLLTTGGGGHWEKTPTRDWHVAAGKTAAAPPIVIRKDGTYTWRIDSKVTVNGRWHVARKEELKYGYDKRGLTLLLEKGEDGKDWLVSREHGWSSDGTDVILIERRDLGLTYRGRRKS
jgi:hypothetical protein